jgi:hypothetical protein
VAPSLLPASLFVISEHFVSSWRERMHSVFETTWAQCCDVRLIACYEHLTPRPHTWRRQFYRCLYIFFFSLRT